MPLEKTLEILKKDAAEGKLDADLVNLFIHRKLYQSPRKSHEKEDDDERE
jgi:hypothetical protein